MVRYEFIVGSEGFNGCELIYETEPAAFQEKLGARNDKPRIMYLEQNRPSFTVNELASDPFCFLFRPPDGGLPAIFGKGIFSAISLHLLKVFLGQRSPICGEQLAFRPRFQTIFSENPDADTRLNEMIIEG